MAPGAEAPRANLFNFRFIVPLNIKSNRKWLYQQHNRQKLCCSMRAACCTPLVCKPICLCSPGNTCAALPLVAGTTRSFIIPSPTVHIPAENWRSFSCWLDRLIRTAGRDAGLFVQTQAKLADRHSTHYSDGNQTGGKEEIFFSTQGAPRACWRANPLCEWPRRAESILFVRCNFHNAWNNFPCCSRNLRASLSKRTSINKRFLCQTALLSFPVAKHSERQCFWLEGRLEGEV